jgi:hypothetical protein
MTAAGMPRAVTNRAYFVSYAGWEVSWIAEQAQSCSWNSLVIR